MHFAVRIGNAQPQRSEKKNALESVTLLEQVKEERNNLEMAFNLCKKERNNK